MVILNQEMRLKMRILSNKTLFVFLIIHFLVWSLLPLLRTSIPMDSIEAVTWGWLCDWGTNKHPPLSGHLAYGAWVLGNQSAYALYALSQLCVLFGFIYIFKLACRFMDDEKAVLAVMLLEGVIYYGFSAPEFNVNVLSLALWPVTAYYFYRAVVKGNWFDWTLTGIFAGLNLLNKYVSGILLLCMLLFMIFDHKARQRFKQAGPYICALVTALVFAPHAFWLYEHNFFTLNYFLARSGKAAFENAPILNHLVYPLKFLGAQILFGLGALLIYVIGIRKAPRRFINLSGFESRFLVWLGMTPVIIMALISFVGGIKLKTMWGFPALYMLGILLLAFSKHLLTEAARRKMVIGTYILMLLMAIAYATTVYFNKGDKVHLHPLAYAYQMENLWDENADGKPLKYVMGDVWWADNVALFAPSAPKPVIMGNPSQNPWIDKADLDKSGALIVTADPYLYGQISRTMENISAPLPVEVMIRNPQGKVKFKKLYYGFYNLGTK